MRKPVTGETGKEVENGRRKDVQNRERETLSRQISKRNGQTALYNAL